MLLTNVEDDRIEDGGARESKEASGGIAQSLETSDSKDVSEIEKYTLKLSKI